MILPRRFEGQSSSGHDWNAVLINQIKTIVRNMKIAPLYKHRKTQNDHI